MDDRLTDRVAAWLVLLRAHGALVEALERRLELERSLPLPWYEVLFLLGHAPGRKLRMQELARSVLLSKSGLSRLVDRMEGSGLLVRETCLSDRRGTYAVLTGKGRALLRRAMPVFLGGIEEHFGRLLSEGEVRTLRTLMGKLLQGNGLSEEACLPPTFVRRTPPASRGPSQPGPA